MPWFFTSYCRWAGLLLWAWLWLPHTAMATHIVGGEIELLRLPNNPNGATHQINLNLYFDVLNGNPGARDNTVVLYLFRLRDNAPMGYVSLPLVRTTDVPYKIPACSRSDLQTQLMQYSANVTFDRSMNDPGGYYISWERCCRNNIITNIVNPAAAGSTFYLEFPAPYSGTTLINNSSPIFTPAKGDYICIGQPFTFDFSAKDPDGDSLTYTLVTPYNGYSTSAVPNPGALDLFGQPTGVIRPGPYPPVAWQSGISERNAIPGPDPLRVDARTGLLRVTADQAGLYVFSVEVTEYRNGKRIGRVRRDFQLRVIDCPNNNAPKLLLKNPNATSFYQEGTTLTLTETEANCLTLYVTDRNPNQHISISTLAGALPGQTFSPGVLTTRTDHDTLSGRFCFGRCAGANGNPFVLQLLATDDGCPQGLSDTLTVRLNLISSGNQAPQAGTDLPGAQAQVAIGSSLSFTAFGSDTDKDSVTIRAVGRGFTLSEVGMAFQTATGAASVNSPFRWRPTCSTTPDKPYVVDFIVSDARCTGALADTVTVTLTAKGVPSQTPTIRTSLPQPAVELTVSANPNTGGISFTVLGDDPDRDSIRLTAIGRGFDPKAYGMSFTPVSGKPVLQTPFSWQPTCALLAGKPEGTFVVDFVVDDRSCQPRHTDTTTVTFHVIDPAVEATITIPNVFTPNGDGINDYFSVDNLPENACSEQFKSVLITNRYGRTVYTSADPHFRWEGTNAPVGTYYYLIQTTKRTFKGPLTLLR